MIRLLAVDMDGTCLNSKNKITPKTLEALQAAAASGIIVVPTTGRALTCLPHQLLAQQGLLYRYVISSNGARVTDCADSTTIYQAEIPLADACGLLSALQGQRLGWTAHVNQEYLVQGRLLHRMGRFIYGKDAQISRRVSQLSETRSKWARMWKNFSFSFCPPALVLRWKPRCLVIPSLPLLTAADMWKFILKTPPRAQLSKLWQRI